MACSTCMSVRRSINSALLRPLGLPQLPVQTSAPPTPTAQPTQQRTNHAFPPRTR